MDRRNYSIDLLKLYFACNIALGHAHLPTALPLINIDYVVTLFFILSGYFLVQSFDSGKYATPWQYTMNRVCRIWPYYFCAFLILLLYTQLHAGFKIGQFLRTLCQSLPEILMLQNVGLFSEGINFPTWQLSTLVFGSHLLFTLLVWNRQMTLNFVCPVLASCLFTCLGQDVDLWGTVGYFFYVPMLRAIAGLSLGIFLYDPFCLLRKKLAHIPLGSAIMSAGAILMAILLWLNRDHATMLTLPFMGLLFCLLYPDTLWARLFHHPLLRHLDKLSLGIYMNHVLFMRILENHPYLLKFGFPTDLLFLACVTGFSVITMWLIDQLLRITKTKAELCSSVHKK